MAFLLHKWLVASLALLHPLFVSVTEINHNPKEKTLEISCKTFADDLEKGIDNSAKLKLDLFKIKDSSLAEKGVNDYIKKHLQVKVDGKPVNLEFVGFEREGDALWSYFQISNVASVKKIEINNTILHDVSNDQINLVHVTVGGNRKSTKLDYPASQSSYDF
ncbi:MAG TPA: DUF6702 family protein [Chitinophagaceae bacterium]|nr:DUF6702 family protein [Chitinophagaceae bacterium]